MAPPPLKKFSKPPFINKKKTKGLYIFFTPPAFARVLQRELYAVHGTENSVSV